MGNRPRLPQACPPLAASPTTQKQHLEFKTYSLLQKRSCSAKHRSLSLSRRLKEREQIMDGKVVVRQRNYLEVQIARWTDHRATKFQPDYIIASERILAHSIKYDDAGTTMGRKFLN